MTADNFHPKYRPDIDGLRALAILPVVAYHAFPRYAPGGFIGVDIFFVISGYLISLIIFRSLINNDFSFAEFYAHRIKRIFPALILVASMCYAVGWFALLPDEFKQLGKHIAAGMGFMQNFVLWKEAGYFDVASELKPLMHLWSLAVEEQFYLIFPLLVWAAWKARLNVLAGVIVLGVISFVLNQKGIDKDAVKTFFAPQTRFWELMAGSVLAYIYGFRVWRPSFTRWIHTGIFNRLFFREVRVEQDRGLLLPSVLSFLGLALIVYSIAGYNHTMPYPGVRAVAPVLGAVLLILAGPQAWVNRQVLSRKVVIWVGLISYPLYLWHWPVLSFTRIVESETPSRATRITAVTISFILAALTYYLIERKIRYGKATTRKVAVLIFLAILTGLIGYITYKKDVRNNAEFISNQERMIIMLDGNTHALSEYGYVSDSCRKMFPENTPIFCRISRDYEPNIILIGDSHAAALFYGLLKQAADDETILNVGSPGCIPFFDVDRFNNGTPKGRCVNEMDRWLTYAENTKSINTVILSSMGPVYLTRSSFSNLDKRTENESVSYNGEIVEPIERAKMWQDAMRHTLNRLVSRGKNVIFVIDNPELDFHPRSCISNRPLKGLLNSNSFRCAVTYEAYKKRNAEYKSIVGSVLTDFPSVRVFDTSKLLCDESWCWAKKDGRLLYYDIDHLSLDGSIYVGHEILKIIRN